MSNRYTTQQEETGDTFVLDTETDNRAWFGDIPEVYLADIVEKMNTEDDYADKYAWVDEAFNLVR